MISFNTIPASIRTPGQRIEFDSSRAVSGLPPIANRVLLIGLLGSAATVDALTIEPVASANQAKQLFGRGSQLARMVAAYKAADAFSEVHAIGLDEVGDASAAEGTITVAGPASAAGTIALMVAGERIAIPVATAAANTSIAAAIAAAINVRPDLPVTAEVGDAPDTNVVTLTARHGGTAGNDIDIRHSHFAGEALPAGVGLNIVSMAGGAGDPDIDPVWDAVGDEEFRVFVLGTGDNTAIGSLAGELDDRASAQRMLEGVGFAARRGDQAALSLIGANFNSEFVSLLGVGSAPTCPALAATAFAATIGYHSAIDPARPLQTLTITGMVAPRVEDRFARSEREQLLRDGIATFTVGQDGTCRIERAITTYQTDSFDIEDVAFLDIETILTLFFLRQSLRARIAAKFPRHKLADDGTRFGAGQAIVTPSTIRAELLALAREWETLGLVEGIDQFKADLIVERDASDPNRINALVPPDIVNQFRVFAGAVQFRL